MTSTLPTDLSCRGLPPADFYGPPDDDGPMTSETFDRILLAVDGSPQSHAATLATARMARSLGSGVVVVHVWTADGVPGPGSWQAEPPANARALLTSAVKEIQRVGVEATGELRSAPIHEVAGEIVAAAEQHGTALIVLGSRGLSDIRGLFLGSVSHRVIEKSDRPVLVARDSGYEGSGPVRRILLAVAAGEDVPGSVAAAVAIAQRSRAEVLVLNAISVLPDATGIPFVDSEMDAQQVVGRTLDALRQAGITATAHAPLSVGVAHQIAEEATAWNADVIIMGSRRLSDWGSLFLGGVSHEVMHLSDRPVLVARREDSTVGVDQGN
jgi:nucleotide-binding universal stress UspA family protein